MTRLGKRQHAILFEAGRRLREFHSGENPLEAWTGLGMPSEYRTVVKAGLMRPTSREIPRCPQWYVLTEKGLYIVEGLGYLSGLPCPPGTLKHVLSLS